MISNQNTRMVLALLCITILAVVLSYALLPYIEAFFAAFILYVIFKPVYRVLVERGKIRKDIAALGVIALSVILVLIPLYFIFVAIVNQTQGAIDAIISNLDLIYQYADKIEDVVPSIDLEEKIVELISLISSFVSKMLLSTIQNAGSLIVGLMIMVFLLYYLFTSDDIELRQRTSQIIPFSKENTEILMRELKNVIHSTIIATLLIALIQGGLLAVTFYLLGIEGALLWGFITAILSFMPVVGAPFVWVPAVAIQLIQHDYRAGIAILIAGIIISNVDNFLRPFIQKKVGAMHPFVSLLGIFVGVYLFGLIGIVVGPLILSAFLLSVKMFNEEYLE